MTTEAHDLRYPIGKQPSAPATTTADERNDAIGAIAEMPEQLREALRGLDDEQLNTPYRPDGWTVRQLVHHIADSHMTAFHRLCRALTEDWPEIHGYNEKAFADLADKAAPAEWSVDILEGTHARWAMLLESLTDEQWKLGYRHSERGPQTLEQALILYAWHSKHHVAHITSLRLRENW
jgi:hypothetical protein